MIGDGVQGGDDRPFPAGDLNPRLGLKTFGTADMAVVAHINDRLLIGVYPEPPEAHPVSVFFLHAFKSREIDPYGLFFYTFRKRCLQEELQAVRSTRTATASPPPMQRLAIPLFLFNAFRAYRRVTRIRAPLAPIGCPSATAPPRTLTRSGSSSSRRLTAMEEAEKASLISKRSISDIFNPVFSRRRRIA